MIKETILSHAELVERIKYDPKLGTFRWTNSPLNTNRSRSKPTGEYSFSKDYGRICINNEFWTARQIAWYWITGEVPQGRISAKDGDPKNYRFDNLLYVPSMNNGEKYICKCKSGNTYQYKVRKKGKYYGFANTLEKAIEIRDSFPELL